MKFYHNVVLFKLDIIFLDIILIDYFFDSDEFLHMVID
jgi:hypothetical protein